MSPIAYLILGTKYSTNGAALPMATLQKSAGFSYEAHLRYRRGWPQKRWGIAADILFDVEKGRREVVLCSVVVRTKWTDLALRRARFRAVELETWLDALTRE